MGLSIAELDLVPEVAAKALQIQKAHPQVIFTSGRRTLQQQCQAMASNIISSGNRRWIGETYLDSHAIRALQDWVTTHPANTTDAIAAGLLEVMQTLSSADQTSISRHLTGHAFDCAVGSVPISVIEATHPEKLLTREAGISKIHVQY